jgi:apolipoprotein N-acyltransferase
MQKLGALLDRYPRWLALLAGGVSATGFAPLDLWPLTLLCLALLMQLTAKAATGKRAFTIGWLFGLGYFTVGNNWIATAFTYQSNMPAWLGWLAVPLLALYLAVYPALAAWGAWWIGTRFGIGGHAIACPPIPDGQAFRGQSIDSPRNAVTLPFILAFAGCWIITEWLRSWVFTGFAWNPLGVIAVSFQWPTTWIGTYGLGGLIILVCGFPFWWDKALPSKTLAHKRLVGLAIVITTIAITKLSTNTAATAFSTTSLTIVQPNISQIDKYKPGYEALNFSRLAQNSRPFPDEPARLLLWPEAAIPWWLEDGYPPHAYLGQPGGSAIGARQTLAQLLGPEDVLLTGADRLEFDEGGDVAGARNSVLAINAKGDILTSYDKAHLVPYGEYLALRWLLEPLGASRLVPGSIDFWPGPRPRTLNLGKDKPKVGLQICYEIIFSGQVADRANRPDFIFNPSNDAWFGSWGPPQHLAQARLRAVEEGLPVIRSTPTGISAVIDADGRILESLPLGKAGRIDAKLPRAKAPTLFARYGNILPLALAALLIALAFFPLVTSRASR